MCVYKGEMKEGGDKRQMLKILKKLGNTDLFCKQYHGVHEPTLYWSGPDYGKTQNPVNFA